MVAFAERAQLQTSTLNGYLVGPIDVSSYKFLSLQIEGTFVGTLSFLWSNDGVNYRSVILNRIDTANVNNSGVSTSSSGIGFCGPITFHYFAVQMSAYTSGTAIGTLDLLTETPGYLLSTLATVPSSSGTQIVTSQVVTLLSVANAAQASYQSADIPVAPYNSLILDIIMTAITGGTSPTVTFKVERKDTQGNYLTIDLPNPQSTTPGFFVRSIGMGLAQNANYGGFIRVTMVTTGAPTSVNFSLSLVGRY